jgi:FkbM family methyltransferase
MATALRLDPDGITRPADDQHGIEHDGLVADIDEALDFCADRDVAVQAGGCYGVWPLYLSRLFRHVYTFEPDWDNFRCLVVNVEIGKSANVIPIRAALANRNSLAALKRAQPHNAGSGYLVKGAEFPTLRLDALELAKCDLLCLDVEGAELDALQGAVSTIERCRPVIMLEAKPLEHMQVQRFAAIEWLQARGYEVRRKIHKDFILTRR